VGDDLAGEEGLVFLAAHAVPGEGGGGVVGAGGLGKVEDGVEGGAWEASDAICYTRWKLRWGRAPCGSAFYCMIDWASRLCTGAGGRFSCGRAGFDAPPGRLRWARRKVSNCGFGQKSCWLQLPSACLRRCCLRQRHQVPPGLAGYGTGIPGGHSTDAVRLAFGTETPACETKESQAPAAETSPTCASPPTGSHPGSCDGLPTHGVADHPLTQGSEKEAQVLFCGGAGQTGDHDFERSEPLPEQWLLIEWPQNERQKGRGTPDEVLVREPCGGNELSDPGSNGQTPIDHRAKLRRAETGACPVHYQGRARRGFHHHATPSVAG